MRLPATNILLLAPLVSLAHAQQLAAPVAPVAPIAPVAAPNAPAPIAPVVPPAVAAPVAPVAPVAVPGVGGGLPPPVTQAGQVPAVTQVNNAVTGPDGQIKQVPTVYTQTFAAVPSQGPTPVQGVIGLGTLTGTVGALRTEQAKKGEAGGRVQAGWVAGGVGILGAVVGGMV